MASPSTALRALCKGDWISPSSEIGWMLKIRTTFMKIRPSTVEIQFRWGDEQRCQWCGGLLHEGGDSPVDCSRSICSRLSEVVFMGKREDLTRLDTWVPSNARFRMPSERRAGLREVARDRSLDYLTGQATPSRLRSSFGGCKAGKARTLTGAEREEAIRRLEERERG